MLRPCNRDKETQLIEIYSTKKSLLDLHMIEDELIKPASL